MNGINKILFDISIIQQEFGDEIVIAKFEQNVLMLKNPELSYYFAKNVKGADVKAHEKVF